MFSKRGNQSDTCSFFDNVALYCMVTSKFFLSEIEKSYAAKENHIKSANLTVIDYFDDMSSVK